MTPTKTTMTLAQLTKNLDERRKPLLEKAQAVLAEKGIKDTKAYQWRIGYKNAKGGYSTTSTIEGGTSEMTLSEAMSFTTDFVVDRFIDAHAYGFNHWK